MQTEKELQEFVGAGVRVALCSLCISILAFVPPLLYASVSPCVSAYLRCKKQQAIPWLGFRRGADVGSSVALWKYASVLAEICGRLACGWGVFILFISPPCCRRSVQHQLPPLSLLLGWWQWQSFVDSESKAAFRKFTGSYCEMVPRSGYVRLWKKLMWDA